MRTDQGLSHLTEDEIVAYLGHELTGDPLRRAELHLARCAVCREEVIEATEILRPSRRARWPVLAPAAAAAAVMILFLGWPQTPPSGLRDAEITASVSPVAVAPLGRTDALGTLVWTAVPQADFYEVTLFSGDAVLWESRTQDTFAVVPDSVHVGRGVSNYWQVRARIDWDRWSQSELAEFTIVPRRDNGH